MVSGDRQRLVAYGLIAAAATMWGSVGVLSKTLYGWGVSPWSLIFLRSLLGFLACGLVMLLVDRAWFRVTPRDLLFLAAYGLVSTAGFFALYHYTISLTTVAVAVVLLYTAPAFAAIIARLVFREAMTPTKVVALALGFGGCVLVAELGKEQPAVVPLGVATGLGAALTYALFGIVGKSARRRHGAWTIMFYAMGFGTLFLAPLLAMPEAQLRPYPGEVWLLLLALAAGPTLLSRVLYVAAVKHVEASRAAIVATVEPVSASVFAFLLLGETLSSSQLLGGVLVLAGAMLAQLQVARLPVARSAGETRRARRYESSEPRGS